MNKSNLFSLDEAIGESWQVFKKSPFQIIGFLILLGVITVANSYIFSFFLSGLNGDLGFAVIEQVESWIFSSLLQIALLTFTLNLLSTKKTKILSRLTDVKLVLKVIVGTLLTTLIFIGGLILLIVPGIYFAFRLWLVTYYIIDQGAGPIEAIKKSWKTTKGHFFSLLGLSLVLLLINLFGLILLVVGLLVTIPLTYISSAWVYKRLAKSDS